VNMWKRAVPVLLCAATAMLGCEKKIRVGRVVTCRQCGKEIENTVRETTTSIFDKSGDRIERRQVYCDRCGNEIVSYTIRTRCQRCGKVYDTDTRQARRRDGKSDQTLTSGYCSSNCERWGKIEGGIDKASRAAGDAAGRVGKGFFEGLKKHIE